MRPWILTSTFNMTQQEWIERVVKPALFIVCLIPLALMAWDAFNNQLGANPIEKIMRRTGDWTLRFLLITLTITPARQLLNLPWLIKLRRMLGLFAFFYALLHFTNYIWLDQYFDVDEIIKDVIKRKYITVGFVCFLMLIPLAITSTNNMVKRLGGKRWQKLHKSVYAIAIGGVIGIAGAVGALGGVVINLGLRASYLGAAASATAAFVAFTLCYLVFAILTRARYR